MPITRKTACLSALLLLLHSLGAVALRAQDDLISELDSDKDAEKNSASEQPTSAGDATLPNGEFVFSDQDYSASEKPAKTDQLEYVLEDIRIFGNKRTRTEVIRSYVPFRRGQKIAPESTKLQSLQWKIVGTGWFDEVKLRLVRGSRRGWVILEIHVHERNTVVVRNLAFGFSEGLVGNTKTATTKTEAVSPYVGLGLSETNLAGYGIELGGDFLLSRRQKGLRLSLNLPRHVGTRIHLRTAGFYNDGSEAFGNQPTICYGPPTCVPGLPVDAALVRYRRSGFMLGTRIALGRNIYSDLDMQYEFVNVLDKPDNAEETFGASTRPIDFAIEDGKSHVSSLNLGLVFDTRDDPAITTRGNLWAFNFRGAAELIGSDYNFIHVETRYNHWWRISTAQAIRLGTYVGAVFYDAPFFYKFHVSDLTDLIPSRILEMQLDRRAPPNLLHTSISQMRTEELAARLDLTYLFPIYLRNKPANHRRFMGYLTLGIYGLGDLDDGVFGVPGAQGAANIPVDLTFDFGVQLDTRVGVFQLGFSNLLGFVPL